MDQNIDDLFRHLDKKKQGVRKKTVSVKSKKNNEKLPSRAVQKQNGHSRVTTHTPKLYVTAPYGT